MALSLFLSIFSSYPELFLAAACFLVFLTVRRVNRAGGLPVEWPVVGHIPYLLLHSHHLHDWLVDVLRRSGRTFVFKGPAGTSRDVVLTCDPADVNHVFTSNFTNYPKGEDFADLFDFLGHGIFNSDNDSWAFQRRKAQSLMGSRKFRAFVLEASRSKVETSLVPLLDRFAADGHKVLDLQDAFLRLSFDVTCTLVFGVDPGCLSPELPTVPFAAAMDDAEEAAFFRQTVPVAWWKALRWVNAGPERRMAAAVKVMDGFINGFVSRRVEGRRGGAHLLASYLDSRAEVADSGVEDFDGFIRDTALNLMVAGRDTIGSALTWFFYSVATNPGVEAKIVEEVRTHGVDDLGKLVYLHAALCESLRLYPPVPFEHKGAVEPDRLPSGVEVHVRRRVLFSTYAMARMEGVWGDDCTEFRPERWVSPASGRARHEPACKFFAFNAGPRACLGKDVAFTQMKAVAAAVVGRFRVRVAEGFVARPKLSIILHMKGGLKVRVWKREDDE